MNKEDNNENFFTLSQIKKSKELKQVEKGLVIYQEKKTKLVVINNQDDYNKASDFVKDIAVAYKKIEQKRKFFVDPYRQVVNEINSIFKEKTNNLEILKEDVKKVMLSWYQKEKERIRKEQQKIEEQNAKKIEKAKEKNKPMPPVLKHAPAEIEKTSKGVKSFATVKQLPKWEVVDFSKLKDEYKTTDKKKIDKLVKAGLREIEGLRIYFEDNLAVG